MTEEHVPTRPSWECPLCGQLWPCAPAKVRLSEEYADDVGSLLIYLGTTMWEAIDDSFHHSRRGPLPDGLRDRFLDWAMDLRKNDRPGPFPDQSRELIRESTRAGRPRAAGPGRSHTTMRLFITDGRCCWPRSV